MGVKDLDKIILSTLFEKSAQTSVWIWFHLGKVQHTPPFWECVVEWTER